LLERILTCREY